MTMRMTPEDEEAEEVQEWLRSLWDDDDFECYGRDDFSGTYTRRCYFVRRGGRDYVLKRYNPVRFDAARAEVAHYQRLNPEGRHGIFPELVSVLPHLGAENSDQTCQGILIPFYGEFNPESVLEKVACGLSLSVIFKYFAADGLIYFDLKRDALRVDEYGGLKLIDFTDLLTLRALDERNRGLPVDDRDGVWIPPEGRRYQKVYSQFRNNRLRPKAVRRRSVTKAALRIDPEDYQTFILAAMILNLLGGNTLRDKLVRRHLGAADGDLGEAERRELNALLKSMRLRTAARRLSLEEVGRRLWEILRPHLAAEGGAGGRDAARRLLRTITRDERNGLLGEIHAALGKFWR